MVDKIRTARTTHCCTASSWHSGCGRVIEKGERYLSFTRGGLSTFAVCGECAGMTRQQADAQIGAMRQSLREISHRTIPGTSA